MYADNGETLSDHHTKRILYLVTLCIEQFLDYKNTGVPFVARSFPTRFRIFVGSHDGVNCGSNLPLWSVHVILDL